MSNVNIHIHIPPDGQHTELRNSKSSHIESIQERANNCVDWKSLHQINFNSIGLAIHKTHGGRYILCRLEQNKPMVENIVDDYIFVGSDSQLDDEISPRSSEVIQQFIKTHAGDPQYSAPNYREYHKHYSLYGTPIHIANEAMVESRQEIIYLSKLL